MIFGPSELVHHRGYEIAGNCALAFYFRACTRSYGQGASGEVIPRYYDRDSSGTPKQWIRVMKRAIQTVAPHFSARRMVKEYVERMYVPAGSGHHA